MKKLLTAFLGAVLVIVLNIVAGLALDARATKYAFCTVKEQTDKGKRPLQCPKMRFKLERAFPEGVPESVHMGDLLECHWDVHTSYFLGWEFGSIKGTLKCPKNHGHSSLWEPGNLPGLPLSYI